jgi:CHAT domain-containing protein
LAFRFHRKNKLVAPAWQRLSNLVYAPLAKYLANVSHLIVCPDGQLSRLPFEMLRDGDKFLIEEFMQTNSLPSVWGSAFTRPGPPKGGTPNVLENPMVRCGIALAGANHAQQIINAMAEDGLLTGLEASLLNLQGTELVILSACDTGTGEVKIGEGVLSLRRAFRIAGAESVLASHWKVSDKVTSQLMTEFMRRWRSGEPRAKHGAKRSCRCCIRKNFPALISGQPSR